jgi:ribose 5-phosphate isomerase B
MRIAIASDVHGSAVKRRICLILQQTRPDDTLIDLGPAEPGGECDPPDVAIPVAAAVAQNAAERGILVGSTGIGMVIAANKVLGVRAIVATLPCEAEAGRQHEDANVLCLSEFPKDLESILRAWFETQFEGTLHGHPNRHARRVQKIIDLEREQHTSPSIDRE